MNHRVTGPYREKAWPRQWIAMCSCGKGTRCNSYAEAIAFLEQMGCK